MPGGVDGKVNLAGGYEHRRQGMEDVLAQSQAGCRSCPSGHSLHCLQDISAKLTLHAARPVSHDGAAKEQKLASITNPARPADKAMRRGAGTPFVRRDHPLDRKSV